MCEDFDSVRLNCEPLAALKSVEEVLNPFKLFARSPLPLRAGYIVVVSLVAFCQ